MAQKERFIEAELDRTPYGACIVVVVIVTALFFAAVVGVWKLGQFIRQNLNLPSTQQIQGYFPSDDPFAGAQAELDQLKAEAQIKANAKVEEQKEAAKDAAIQAAKDEVNNQIEDFSKKLTQ